MISFSPERKFESRDRIVFSFVFLAISRVPDIVGTLEIFTWKQKLKNYQSAWLYVFLLSRFPLRDKVVK